MICIQDFKNYTILFFLYVAFAASNTSANKLNEDNLISNSSRASVSIANINTSEPYGDFLRSLKKNISKDRKQEQRNRPQNETPEEKKAREIKLYWVQQTFKNIAKTLEWMGKNPKSPKNEKASHLQHLIQSMGGFNSLTSEEKDALEKLGISPKLSSQKYSSPLISTFSFKNIFFLGLIGSASMLPQPGPLPSYEHRYQECMLDKLSFAHLATQQPRTQYCHDLASEPQQAPYVYSINAEMNLNDHGEEAYMFSPEEAYMDCMNPLTQEHIGSGLSRANYCQETYLKATE